MFIDSYHSVPPGIFIKRLVWQKPYKFTMKFITFLRLDYLRVPRKAEWTNGLKIIVEFWITRRLGDGLVVFYIFRKEIYKVYCILGICFALAERIMNVMKIFSLKKSTFCDFGPFVHSAF